MGSKKNIALPNHEEQREEGFQLWTVMRFRAHPRNLTKKPLPESPQQALVGWRLWISRQIQRRRSVCTEGDAEPHIQVAARRCAREAKGGAADLRNALSPTAAPHNTNAGGTSR